ncbi:hypothetical protein PF003_g28013 [Phytophthora fragariae]|nr:hypothetical protein PF003_g28013 [Phytophthora fragariae]
MPAPPTHPSPAPPSSQQPLRRPALAEAFGVHARTVSRVWGRAVSNFDRNESYASLSQMHRTGRPRTDRARELEWLRGVDPQQRSTIRSAAQACFLPPTTLFRELRLGKLCIATSVAKPMLTEENKMKSISFSVEVFDGKLGTSDFLKHEPAKRSSCNRPAGTMVPYPVTVNKTSYREMLTELVLPSIRAKFPGTASGRRITVQQDNAPPPHPAR